MLSQKSDYYMGVIESIEVHYSGKRRLARRKLPFWKGGHRGLSLFAAECDLEARPIYTLGLSAKCEHVVMKGKVVLPKSKRSA